ncbi:MAG: sulfite exporter TauE/SafE family protein [Fidelibacterota bacterium]
MTEFILPILFFFIALIYSSVGLGGGSSYTAIMAIFGISYHIIPTTSLSLNLIVTSIGVINFWRNGHGKLTLILPFMATSIPLSYFAGTLNLSKEIFQILLLITLILVTVRIYMLTDYKFKFQLSGVQKWIFIFYMGAVLGFVSGAVGIGGGIYLVPLIIMFGLGNEKEAAAAGALFIWVNSLAGVIARAQTGTIDLAFILPLAGAVTVGGIAGSYFGSFKFETKTIQKIMGIVVVIAIIFLLREIL